MKRLLSVSLILAVFVIAFSAAKVAKASVNDTAGLHALVVDEGGTPMSGVQVTYSTDNGGGWASWLGWKGCQGGSNNGAYVYFPTRQFFGNLINWSTWGDGWARSGEGAQMDGGGITYGNAYGFACGCNALILFVHLPYGYTYGGASNSYAAQDMGNGWIKLWYWGTNDFHEIFGYVPDTRIVLRHAVRSNHDAASCTVTSGWACDLRNINHQTPIHLYQTPHLTEWDSGGGYLPVGSANQYRPDIVSAGVCGGSGGHGFSMAVPDTDSAGHSLKDGKDHWIWAYGFNAVDGGPYLLSATPKKINCAPTPYTITIDKNEVGNDGKEHTWNYEVQRYNPGGTWGAGGVTKAQITIPAASKSGSVRVTLPEKDAAKDCADNGGNCLYRVVEKDIDVPWDVERDTSSNITLTNLNRTGTASFENTYEDPNKDDLTTTLTPISGLDAGRYGPSNGRLGFTKSTVVSGTRVGFRFRLTHNTNKSDRLTNVQWSMKTVRACDGTNCSSPVQYSGGNGYFDYNDGGTDFSMTNQTSQGTQSFTKTRLFTNPDLAYQIEVTAKVGHTTNLSDPSGMKSYRFWVVPQRVLSCDLKINPLEFILGQSTRAISPTGIIYYAPLSRYAALIDPSYRVNLTKVRWNINWQDGTVNSNPVIPVSHTYSATKPTVPVKLNITGMSGVSASSFTNLYSVNDANCKQSLKVRSNSKSVVDPVSPNR